MIANPIDYGADPTGASYSDAAFGAALDASPERSSVVVIPPGVYTFAAPIVLGNTTQLIGSGANMVNQRVGSKTLTYHPATVLRFPHGTDGIVAPDDPSVDYRCHHPIIRDLTIVGSGASNGKRGVWLRENRSATIPIQRVGLGVVRHVYVQDFGAGIDLDATADSCHIIDCHVHDCRTGYVGGKYETHIERCVAWALTSVGVTLAAGSEASRVVNNELQPLDGDAIRAAGSYSHIGGNIIGDCDRGIVLSGSRHTVVGNLLHRNTTTRYVDASSSSTWGLNQPPSSWDWQAPEPPPPPPPPPPEPPPPPPPDLEPATVDAASFGSVAYGNGRYA